MVIQDAAASGVAQLIERAVLDLEVVHELVELTQHFIRLGAGEQLQAISPASPSLAFATGKTEEEAREVFARDELLDHAHRPGRTASTRLHLRKNALQVRDATDAVARHEGLVEEGDRAIVGMDQFDGLFPNLFHPRAEVGEVADRCRQPDEVNALRREDDALFPDRAAIKIADVVDLVHDHVRDVPHPLRRFEDGVAEDLGGHDLHRGVRIQSDVPGHQADVIAVVPAKVPILLIGERLDRGGVDDAAPLLEAQLDGVFGDDGLAGASWGRHQDRATLLDGRDCGLLEGVEFESPVVQAQGPFGTAIGRKPLATPGPSAESRETLAPKGP